MTKRRHGQQECRSFARPVSQGTRRIIAQLIPELVGMFLAVRRVLVRIHTISFVVVRPWSASLPPGRPGIGRGPSALIVVA